MHGDHSMNRFEEMKLVDKWKDVEIGTEVIVTFDDGTKIFTRTRSKASLLWEHTAVIFLENISCMYRLSRVELNLKAPDPELVEMCANDSIGG